MASDDLNECVEALLLKRPKSNVPSGQLIKEKDSDDLKDQPWSEEMIEDDSQAAKSLEKNESQLLSNSDQNCDNEDSSYV